MKLTYQEKFKLAENMRRYGGNFMSRLADALMAADPDNTERLCIAFAEEFDKYKNFGSNV